MASSPCWSAPLTVVVVLFLALCQHVQAAAFNVEYCSTLNTADTPRNVSIYQSNSLCYDFCGKDSYAFAVVQYQGCWCSNYVPASTTTGCTLDCPGWQEEKCGGSGLYGYIELPNNPSGTKGASAASSTSAGQATVTSTPDAVTIIQTTTAVPSTATSSSQSTASTQTTATSSTRSTSSTWTPTPVTSLETITGSVRTLTVTPTVPPNSQATNSIVKSDKGGGGLGTGGAVGLTIGLVALVALIGAIVFFCLRKRRRQREASLEHVSRRGSSAGLGAAIAPSRTMSENSRYVLGTDGRRVVENWEAGEQEEIRRSRLMPVDQRLDPFSPVYQRDNKSRESVNTIRDDHDYSRRVASGPGKILRATNPD